MNKVTLAPNFESAPMDGPADAVDAPIAEYAQVQKRPRDASPARSLESQARSVGEMVIKSSRPYVKGIFYQSVNSSNILLYRKSPLNKVNR